MLYPSCKVRWVVLSTVLVLLIFAVGAFGSLEGTWEGRDVDDGSEIVLVITRSGDQLTAVFSDSFSTTDSGARLSPGYYGAGWGTATSDTSAELTLSLASPDGGPAVEAELLLTLSGSTLDVSITRWGAYDLSPPEAWATMERVDSATAQTSGNDVAEEDLAYAMYAPGVFDAFDTYLDPAWRWIHEDPAYWSLTPDGTLRIVLQQSPFDVDEMRNLLVRPVPTGDFTAETHLLFEPEGDFQNAGLILFADERNYLKIGREYSSPGACPSCKGNAISFIEVADGQVIAAPALVLVPTMDEIYLRLVVKGGLVDAVYSENGQEWIVLNFTRPLWEPEYIGLYTGTGGEPVSGVSAEFAYFAMQEGVVDIVWARISAEARAKIRALARSSAGGVGSVGGANCTEATATYYSATGSVVGSFSTGGCLCDQAWSSWILNDYPQWYSTMSSQSPGGDDTLDWWACGGSGCYREIVVCKDNKGNVINTISSPCICSSVEQNQWWPTYVAFYNSCPNFPLSDYVPCQP